MRRSMLLVWLMLPVLVGFYHAGPGQRRLQLDDVAATLAQAEAQAAAEQWAVAVAKYEEALRILPADKVQESRRIRLERAKAQMLAEKLPFAHEDLNLLVQELKEDPQADPKLLTEAQAALANSQYYMTWLMRLEGEPKDAWEEEIEAARQTYRLLAEKAEQTGDEASAQRYREDLESVIRLARMDLSDLQGLDLPCQCQGCKSCDCKGKGNKKGKKPGKKRAEKQPKDARGASSGPPPDNRGS